MHSLTLHFHVVALEMEHGLALSVPLFVGEALQLGSKTSLLATRFKTAFQKKILDKGDYLSVLDILQATSCESDTIMVKFPSVRGKSSHPTFEVNFKYFYKKLPNGYWGIIASLGIEVFAEDWANFVQQLEQSIRMEFLRSKRLGNARLVASTLWWQSQELFNHTVELTLHSLTQLDELDQQQVQEKLLPKVARKLSPKVSPLFGMQEAIEHFTRIMQGKHSKSTLIVGVSGVGKTTLVYEMAKRALDSGTSTSFWETTASTLIKELSEESGWQDALARLCKELHHKDEVLFVRNLFELFEVGQYEGNTESMADFLRSFIARNDIVLVSECTNEELAKIELRNPNFSSLFNVIKLEEPQNAALKDIVFQKVKSIAQHHKADITDDAIKECIELCKRFMPYSGFPGKPIRFLENILLATANTDDSDEKICIAREDVIHAFCQESNMPKFIVDTQLPIHLSNIINNFNKNIFGQTAPVQKVVDVLATIKKRLTREGKPITSFLFVGPTGVGKTEMAKQLATFMFGSSERMLRFDMSEYSNPYSVMRLVGGSGHADDGLLTAAVRRQPFCLLLFDEVEKADPLFFDLLLQVLGEGRLTDSKGRLTNFCSSIIVMTSNIGATNQPSGSMSFVKPKHDFSEHFLGEVKKYLRPELFNRIDQVVAFEPLSDESLQSMVKRELTLLQQREGMKSEKVYHLEVQEGVVEKLVIIGKSEKFGVRQLQRHLHTLIVSPIAKALNGTSNDEKLIVRIGLDEKNNTIAITCKKQSNHLESLMTELSLSEVAEQASDLCRQLAKIREGSTYIQVLSKIQLLQEKIERARQKQDETTVAKAERQLKKLILRQSEVTELSSTCEALEIDTALCVMKLQAFDSAWAGQLKNLDDRLLNVKLMLLQNTDEATKHCQIRIFANEQISDVLSFYLRILYYKKYSYNLNLIYRDDTYYKELISTEKDEKPKPRGFHIHKPFDLSKVRHALELPQTDENGRPLCGVEIIFPTNIAHAAFLYFEQENGIQHWYDSNQNQNRYLVRVLNDHRTPDAENIFTLLSSNRKEAGKARREVYEKHFKDTIYKIDMEIPPIKASDILYQKLEEDFLKKIDELLT